MVCRRIVPALVFVVCLMICAGGLAQQPAGKPTLAKQKNQFLRLVLDKSGTPAALESAIVGYVPAKGKPAGLTVDLVGAVHLADKSYYEQLNREFGKYDAVLYELVAPEGTRVSKKTAAPSASPVSLIQNAMTGVLELEFQLKGIDYGRKNMVHADMSPEQFTRSMRRRGESVWTMLSRAMGYAMARQSSDPSGASDGKLLLALFDKNRALMLKRILAEQFEDLGGSMNMFEGPDGSTLIAERNKVALGVLRKQIAKGKRKIAIFYGAGHMPDFEKRLQSDFGLMRGNTRWLVAWDLK